MKTFFSHHKINVLTLGIALGLASLGSASAYEVNAGKVYSSAGQRVDLSPLSSARGAAARAV